MVQYLDLVKAMQELCKATGRWGMYLHFPPPDFLIDRGIQDWSGETMKASPCLGRDQFQMLMDGSGYILADTEEEIMGLYDEIVGDDGPTDKNPYDGPARVYALTCDPKGELGCENT